MNENHQRHLLSTFQYVDNLLAEAEQILASASSASPFQEHSQDSMPIQHKVTHDHILRVREAMRRILSELKIPLKPPVSGVLWAVRGRVAFAGIAIAEVEPERMEQLRGSQEDFLRLASSRLQECLQEWYRQTLNELLNAFDASAGIYQAQVAPRRDAAASNTEDADIQRDINVLLEWEKQNGWNRWAHWGAHATLEQGRLPQKFLMLYFI